MTRLFSNLLSRLPVAGPAFTIIVTLFCSCGIAQAQSSARAGTAVSPAQLSVGLIGHWTGNGTSKDSAGHHDGSVHGGVTYVDGIAGKAFSFDGTGGVAIADDDVFRLTGSLTLSALIHIDDLPPPGAAWGQIIFRGDDRNGLDPEFLAVSPNDLIHFEIDDDANKNESVDATALLGQWVLATGTLDDKTGALVLYIDGDVFAAKQTVIRPLTALDPTQRPGLGIGDVEGGSVHGGEMFNGEIEDVRIYERALSPAEVESLYLSVLYITGLKVTLGSPFAGGDSNGIVDIDVSASLRPVVINLMSSDPKSMTVPATVVVPAGASAVEFPIKTAQVSTPTAVTITATMSGKSQTATANLWVKQ